MKIYIGKNRKNAGRVSPLEAIQKILEDSGWELEAGSFDDHSASWLDLNKKDLKDMTSFTISIIFDGEGNNLSNIEVWGTPLKIEEDDVNTEILLRIK
jgi:hypothetical protein